MDVIKNLIFGFIPNKTCRDHFFEEFKHLLEGDVWALRMFDSTAKIPAGILTGNFENYGYMDECLEVDVHEDFGSFTGKYCIVEFYLPPILHISATNESLLSLRWGACIPSTCSAQDFETLLRKIFRLPAYVDELFCHTLNEERPLRPGEYFTICILVILMMLAFLSTMYDYWGSSAKKRPLLLSFSIRTNLRTLLDTSTVPQSLEFLFGIRFISTTLVLVGHVYFITAIYGIKINPIRYLEWLNSWSHVWMTSRGVMVDSFFVFSGMLCSYQFMRDREKGNQFNLISFYIHRYLRTAPVLLFMLLFVGTLSNRLGTGPLWKGFSEIVSQQCAITWWRNVLFINNWWADDVCMEQTWYLAVDMQLYWLSPLLLLPLYKSPRFGLRLTFTVFIATIFMSFGTSYLLEDKVDMFRNAAAPNMRKMYEATIFRAVPWLIGFISGYFLVKYKHIRKAYASHTKEEKDVNWCNFFLATLAWIIVFGMIAGVIISVHPFMQSNYEYNAFESATYLTLSHLVWSFCTVFGAVLCGTGYGGPFRVLISWKIFIPLSRLSYCIYMLHVLIVKLRIIDAKTTMHVSDYELIMISISVLVVSVLGSCFLYLLVEQPVVVIERILRYSSTGNEFHAEDKCKKRNHRGRLESESKMLITKNTDFTSESWTGGKYINGGFYSSEQKYRKPYYDV